MTVLIDYCCYYDGRELAVDSNRLARLAMVKHQLVCNVALLVQYTVLLNHAPVTTNVKIVAVVNWACGCLFNAIVP